MSAAKKTERAAASIESILSRWTFIVMLSQNVESTPPKCMSEKRMPKRLYSCARHFAMPVSAYFAAQ